MTLQDLADKIEDLTGQPVDLGWLEQALAVIVAYVKVLAPCKKDEWVTVDDLPDDIIAVIVAALARWMVNPRNLRQETIGEYSYTVGSTDGELFSDMEKRIIAGIAGCGGSFKSVTMPVVPAPVAMTTPDETYWATIDYDPTMGGHVYGGPFGDPADPNDPNAPITTTADVKLTNPDSTHTTQEDANQYFVDELDERVEGDGVKKMIYLTKAEYDALPKKDPEAVYVVEE